MKHHSLDLSASRGIALDGIECGDPGGLPVVLLHGLTDSWRAFVPLIAHLPKDCRIIALSMRGHGASPKPESGYAPDDFAGDIEAALEALGPPPALIIGHSLGTLPAQLLAATRPERVAGLVLIGGFVQPSANPLIYTLWEQFFSTLADPLDPQFVRTWQQGASSPDLPTGFLDDMVAESLKAPARVWRDGARALLSTDLTAQVAQISAPVLTIIGADDELCRDEATILASSLPRARHVRLAGLGHAPHWENPTLIAEMIAAFADEIRPKEAA